ncbi:MAG TPA: hypothetical protein VD973_22630 [Symbiobacteriaceae bacterium]|nr:hypothetical protein [Symbiobacteriaceae bacterium]
MSRPAILVFTSSLCDQNAAAEDPAQAAGVLGAHLAAWTPAYAQELLAHA